MMDAELYTSPKLANVLKTVAAEKNISMKTALEECGIGSNAISHLLHGKEMSYRSLAILADYFDVSIDYLLGRTDKPEVNR